eukprot:136782_1
MTMATSSNFVENFRKDLEGMWVDITNLFESVDLDIVTTLSHYESTSLNNNMMPIPEESPPNLSNNTNIDGSSENIQDIVINSDLFLDTLTTDHTQNDHHHLLHTVSMRRLVYVLDKYNKYLSHQLLGTMHNFISHHLGNGSYSVPKLLNDFYFVLYNDHIDAQYESIYNFVSEFIGTKHDPHNHHDDGEDSQEAVTIHILNKIYFYFVHSFDLGNRLPHDEQKQIEQRTASIHSSKSVFIDHQTPAISRYLIEKHSTQKNTTQSNKYMLHNLIEQQYFYWLEHTNQPWFVYPKYRSIKDELLSNTVHVIELNQWNELCEEAQYYQNSTFCKHMMRQYDGYDSVIHIEHLMSILLYSNSNLLRSEFLNTFYRQTNESDLALKSRHSNFAIFARLLNECVQWFGNKIRKNKSFSFYHIINIDQIRFQSTTTNIYVPFSATTRYTVILNQNILHHKDKGMVLKLNAPKHSKYFDLRFVSQYVDECEILFFGGESVFMFVDIIHYEFGYKLGVFMKGLDVIYAMMSGEWYKTDEHGIDDTLQTVVRDMIYKQINPNINTDTVIPSYIANIIDYYASNKTDITLDWSSFCEEKHRKYGNWNGFLFLQKVFLCSASFSEEQWIKLDVLCALFPNVKTIKVVTSRYHNLFLSEFILNQVISFVSSHKDSDLAEISIKKPNESEMSIQEAMLSYGNRFQQNINWNIKQERDKWNDRYLVIHKM